MKRRAISGSWPAGLAVCLLGVGCFPDTTGDTPDPAREYLYYPSALALTKPAGDYLLAANSNFDLQFNSGTLVPFALGGIRDVVSACRGQGETLGCAELVVPTEDEAKDERFAVLDFVLEDHAVLIGSYAGTMATTEGLALVPIRADASLTYVDVQEVPAQELGARRVLRCGYGLGADEPGQLQRCGSARRVRTGVHLRDGSTLAVPAEPFSVVPWTSPDERDPRRFAVVGHMVGGQVSLFEVRAGPGAAPDECVGAADPGCGGERVELVDVESSFPEGTSGLAVDEGGRFLASSRLRPVLTAFRITVPSEGHPYDDQVQPSVAPVRTIPIDEVMSGGEDERGVAVSPSGNRAYIVSRDPESVLVLDITRNERGEHADEFVDIIEVGPGASIIQIFADDRLPGGYLVYVVCFGADRIYVIDPTVDEVVDIIATRRGPHALVFDSVARVGYLANFLESTISIIDVDPDSPRYHEVLTTLGQPRRPRTND